MTSISAAKRLLTRVETYLAGVFHPFPQERINMWVLTPFHFMKHKRLGSWLDGLVTLAVLLSLGYAIWSGTVFAIDEIAKGHAASRSSK